MFHGKCISCDVVHALQDLHCSVNSSVNTSDPIWWKKCIDAKEHVFCKAPPQGRWQITSPLDLDVLRKLMRLMFKPQTYPQLQEDRR